MSKNTRRPPFLGPIVLTEFGEALVPYSKDEAYEDQTISTVAGIHDICRGWLDSKQVSETHDVLRCRQCGLRVYIPVGLKTLGDLRKYLLRFNK
jgi:hypothetical protein